MKNITKQNNWRDFSATCSMTEIIETENYFYKNVNIGGEKQLRYWKQSGRISMVTIN